MDVANIIAEADRLEKSNQWREALSYLQPYVKEASDPELLWRLIRCFYRVGKHLARDKQERDELAQEALKISERALKLGENNYNVQQWSGVLLSWTSELGGTKKKIETSFMVKDHFEKAIQLNGSNALVKHLLGRWCYEVAGITWLQRNVARAIFASPPESSYEEALKYFEDSEETSPGFYTGNWLYLGKTCYQLSKKAEAKKWLTKLLENEAKNAEDREYRAEAEQLIRKL